MFGTEPLLAHTGTPLRTDRALTEPYIHGLTHQPPGGGVTVARAGGWGTEPLATVDLAPVVVALFYRRGQVVLVHEAVPVTGGDH